MKPATHSIAALLLAAGLVTGLSAVERSDQTRTPPPKSAPAPAPPAQGRKPAPGTPPPKAQPRPPVSRPPARPPRRPPTGRALIYPYYLDDFDFVYQFPYGVYPHYPYALPPYGYSFPLPGCVTAEGEPQGTGTLRLDIPQTQAAVYVDGFYAGSVEDFNGATESLTLPVGPHHIELRATGFQTLVFDVNVQPDKTIRYRTPMQPAP